MKNILLRSLLVFAVGFVVLFLLRLGYGYATQPNGVVVGGGYVPQFGQGFDFELSRRNYAGQKSGGGGPVQGTPLSVDQRYEKIATLGMGSEAFDEDEAKVRTVAKDANALIQHEQAYGLEGQRQLQLALGVPPEAFDDVITQLQAIGKPVSFQVNKTDKTNEYRALLAKQDSLKKSRDNLIELKSRDARLDALISLETRILALEEQIQALGVSVGEFDSEFEFVTIKLTLSETRAPELRHISFLRRSKVAFEWAVWASLTIAVALFFFILGVTLLVLVIRLVRNLIEPSAAPK